VGPLEHRTSPTGPDAHQPPPHQLSRPRRYLRWALPLAGLTALIWFLIRVLPKPSRATYPCQRLAFPLASGFLIWLTGMVGSAVALGKARQMLRRSRVLAAALCLAVAVAAGVIGLQYMPETPALADPPNPNQPIGVARGVHPGRVVWVHDPDANDWDGTTGNYWDPGNVDQAVVDEMMSRGLQALAGEATDADAWDALFHHYNQTHDRGDVGYSPTEKISIKVNLVGSRPTEWMNLETYDQVSSLWKVNTSCELMLSLLRQLVYQANVPQANISIGDTITCFPNHLWKRLHDEFPNVVYIDRLGILGRTQSQPSSNVIDWSSPDNVGFLSDCMPLTYAQATYHINLSDLKGHEGGGVTLCGKNYYGSFLHQPDSGGYFDQMHASLPYSTAGYGRYRALVDLVAHQDTGGKGLLYMIDGLWSGSDAGSHVERWYTQPFNNTAPYNGDWPSSLFFSQDPVAIDSVGYDFLYAESLINVDQPFPTSVNGGDDYLQQLASSAYWPAGISYDPEGDGTPIGSLGVHEHWNNSTDRQYSRNLGTGDGIELIALTSSIPGDFDGDLDVDLDDYEMFENCLSLSGPGVTPPSTECLDVFDFDADGDVDMDDFGEFAVHFTGAF